MPAAARLFPDTGQWTDAENQGPWHAASVPLIGKAPFYDSRLHLQEADIRYKPYGPGSDGYVPFPAHIRYKCILENAVTQYNALQHVCQSFH